MKEKFNYRLMLLSNSIACLAFNLIGPFFVLFINKLGGSLENLGLLFGMSILANSIASYFIGKYSDRFGRKPFLLLSSFLSSVIIVLYIYITNLPQLYALQIANGINTAMWMTSERIFMADITKKETRDAN